MRIQLSEHFTYKKLIRFVMPSVTMMVFLSIYSVVDGLFVSNFVGKTPFAALNLIYPVIMALASIGFMLGTGGSAIVAKTLGEKKPQKANSYFSMIIYVGIVSGLVLAVIGFIAVRPAAHLLGATPEMLEDCVVYGRIILAALPAFMLQNMFQSFLVTAEKPKIGLFVTILAGVTNILLDALFVVVFEWGLAGAAIATALSQVVGGVIPLIYFCKKNDSLLRLVPMQFDGRILLKTCTNGSSELMTNLSASLVTTLYNFQLMRLAGENGVAAYGVIMYANFIFSAIFFGYAIAGAPIVSYHYGAQNRGELKNLFRKSIFLIGLTGVVLTLLALLFSSPLSRVFVGYDEELFSMTLRGFRLFAFSFFIIGFNIFGSAFFTALGNGAVSAVIAFMRTLVFQLVVLLILPLIWGLDGIWGAIVVAELLSLGVTVFFFVRKRVKYHYV